MLGGRVGTGTLCRCTARRHTVQCFSQQRPLRPPPPRPDGSRGLNTTRPQQPPSSSTPRSTTTLAAVLAQQKKLWSLVRQQQVKQNSTGICAAPDQPGTVGQRVRLLTNHLLLTASQAFHYNRYRISMIEAKKPKDNISAAAAGSQAGGGESTIPLEQRRLLLAELARHQAWSADCYQYDAASNTLYGLESGVKPCSVEVKLPGATSRMFHVEVAKDTAPTAAGSRSVQQDLQVLGLLIRSFVTSVLPTAVHRNTATLTREAAGMSWSSSAQGGSRGRDGSSAQGGSRGRDGSRGRGSGRGSSRGGGQRGGGSALGFLQLWEGIRWGVKQGQPGAADLMLQLDSTAGVVVPAGELSVLLSSTLPPEATLEGLCRNRRQRVAAEEQIKGVQVTVSYLPGGPRTMTVKSLDDRSAATHTFQLADGSQTTVQEYFKTQYNVDLQHPQWPCVMISKTAAIPLELCRVDKPHARKNLGEAETAELIRVAALPPDRRLDAIKRTMQQVLKRFKNRLLEMWGITVAAELMEVDGHILPDAKVQYRNDVCLDAANAGQWRPSREAKLLEPRALTSWAVVNLTGTACSPGLEQLQKALSTAGAAQGFRVNNPAATVNGGPDASQVDASINAAAAAVGPRPQLLLVVLPETNSSALYEQAKAAAARLGIVCQCIRAQKAGISRSSPDVKPQYASNLLLKINAKLGGVNWQLAGGPQSWAPVFQQPMVLGIDVSHGMGGGRSNKPSIAAVVGSLDVACSRYAASVMQQTPGHEVVLGLGPAVEQLLESRKQGKLPQSLLVYRDGVSDSQYTAVLQQEVAAIRQACKNVGGGNYNPKLTFIVVSKSHGTRLFPTPSGPCDRSKNVLPGTCVDTLITAPTAFEFFINSHAGIQGTNRPARYNVLVDDHNAGPDALQLVTQHLCSIYSACTRTISAPAPVRYADAAAGKSGALASLGGTERVLLQPPAGSSSNAELWYSLLPQQQGMWFV